MLHYAARFANKKTIETLLAFTKEGIDDKNTLGESPYEVALHWQKKDVASLFESGSAQKKETATEKEEPASSSN